PRLSLQQQAVPLQQGLMTLQPSSLRTSFRALSITRIEIKESMICGGRRRVLVDWEDQIRPEIELIEASVRCGVRLVRWRIQFNLWINAKLRCDFATIYQRSDTKQALL